MALIADTLARPKREDLYILKIPKLNCCRRRCGEGPGSKQIEAVVFDSQLSGVSSSRISNALKNTPILFANVRILGEATEAVVRRARSFLALYPGIELESIPPVIRPRSLYCSVVVSGLESL